MRMCCQTFLSAVVALGAAGPVLGGEITFTQGTFGTVAHSKVDSEAVAAFKATADSIAQGTHTNVTEFLPEQMSMWKDEEGKWTLGGMGAFMTVVDGLQAGDIVMVREDWFDRANPSEDFERFHGVDTTYILIGSYAHKDENTILNWLNYGEHRGDDTYRFVKTSAFFEVTDEGSQPPPESIIGWEYWIKREIEVWRGATLVEPIVASRGYSQATSISGGDQVATYSDDVILTIVPEPASLGVLALGGLLLRRRRA